MEILIRILAYGRRPGRLLPQRLEPVRLHRRGARLPAVGAGERHPAADRAPAAGHAAVLGDAGAACRRAGHLAQRRADPEPVGAHVPAALRVRDSRLGLVRGLRPGELGQHRPRDAVAVPDPHPGGLERVPRQGDAALRAGLGLLRQLRPDRDLRGPEPRDRDHRQLDGRGPRDGAPPGARGDRRRGGCRRGRIRSGSCSAA